MFALPYLLIGPPLMHRRRISQIALTSFLDTLISLLRWRRLSFASSRDLCLPRIYLSFGPHLLYVSLQSSWSYQRGGSTTNTLTTTAPTPFICLIYGRALATNAPCPLICVICGWTRACRQSSSFSADCSWDFPLLDQRRMVYRFFFHWLGVYLLYTRFAASVLFRNALLTCSEDAYLSLYSDQWLRRAPLICFIIMAGISILASSVGYTEALKIQLLLVFLAEYVVIFIAYLVPFLLGTFSSVIKGFYLWNMFFSCAASAGALISLVSHLKGKVDFITSLWVSNKIKLIHWRKFL